MIFWTIRTEVTLRRLPKMEMKNLWQSIWSWSRSRVNVWWSSCLNSQGNPHPASSSIAMVMQRRCSLRKFQRCRSQWSSIFLSSLPDTTDQRIPISMLLSTSKECGRHPSHGILLKRACASPSVLTSPDQLSSGSNLLSTEASTIFSTLVNKFYDKFEGSRSLDKKTSDLYGVVQRTRRICCDY